MEKDTNLADALQNIDGLLKESYMEYWQLELDVSKMSWAFIDLLRASLTSLIFTTQTL